MYMIILATHHDAYAFSDSKTFLYIYAMKIRKILAINCLEMTACVSCNPGASWQLTSPSITSSMTSPRSNSR